MSVISGTKSTSAQSAAPTDRNQRALEVLTQLRVEEAVCVVGSGLSRTDGAYPSWGELVEGLCQNCGVDSGMFDLGSPDDLLDAADECKRADGTAYLRTLAEIIGQCATIPTVYFRLVRLPFRYFMTVNFDGCLLEALRTRFDTIKPYVYPNLEPAKDAPSLYHLHGLITNHQQTPVVLSRSEFAQAYDPEHGHCSVFLRSVLPYKSTLFIGWQMREPDMNRLVLMIKSMREAIQSACRRSVQHILLLPTVYGNSQTGGGIDRRREMIEEEYWAELGVCVVRYEQKDRFSGLRDLIEQWSRYEPAVPYGWDTEGPSSQIRWER